MTRVLRAASFAAATLLATSSGAAALSLPSLFSSLAIFGDSLSDQGRASARVKALTGLDYPQPEYYADPDTGFRQFSNGPVWASQLTDQFEGAGRQATNYAFGGARAIEQFSPPPFPFPPVDLIPDLPTQVDEFVADVGGGDFVLGPSSLGIVLIGGNDLPSVVATSFGDDAALKAGSEAVAMAVGQAAHTLFANGLGTVALMNIGDLGRTPAFNLYNPLFAPAATAAAGYFNDQLALEAQTLRALGNAVIEVDLAARLNEVLDDPGLIGLSDAVNPCGVPFGDNPLGLRVYNFLGCVPSPSNTQSVFFDDLHLSKEVQNEILAVTTATIQAAVVPLPLPVAALGGALVLLGGLRLRRAA